MTQFILRSEIQRTTLIERILALDVTKPFEVIIKPYSKKRSIQANSLLHLWIQRIAIEIGDSPDSVKTELKAMFAPRIEHTSQITHLTTFIPKSTSKMTVGELSEFMLRIQAWAWEFAAISLPSPEDLGRD